LRERERGDRKERIVSTRIALIRSEPALLLPPMSTKTKNKAATSSKKSSKEGKEKKKRVRKDTYWHHTDEQNGQYFDSIYRGQDSNYELVLAETKKDHAGRERYCWRVVSKSTGNPASGLRSTAAYRLALVWSAYTVPSFWHHSGKVERLKSLIPTVSTKRGDHSRHRCGNDWCCNPRHILIGSRKANEVDKHYHYFLNHPDPSVRDRFTATFPDLMKRAKVW